MANIQKANQDSVYAAISADTGVDVVHIQQFMKEKGISDPSQLAGDESLLLELMESGKGAIEPATPSKPAPKRGGRGKKGQQAANIEQPNYEAPKNGLQAWQQDTGEKLDVIHEEVDAHLSQVEEAEAGQLVNRFNRVIPNILGIVDEELGRSRGNLDTFRSSFRSVLGSTGVGSTES